MLKSSSTFEHAPPSSRCLKKMALSSAQSVSPYHFEVAARQRLTRYQTFERRHTLSSGVEQCDCLLGSYSLDSQRLSMRQHRLVSWDFQWNFGCRSTSTTSRVATRYVACPSVTRLGGTGAAFAGMTGDQAATYEIPLPSSSPIARCS